MTSAALIENRAEQREYQYQLNPSVSISCTTLPRQYDWQVVQTYWLERPVTTSQRFFHILYELGPIAASYVYHFVLPKQQQEDTEQQQIALASQLREALTNLGPAFVKAGQQLSIRPDLVPPAVLKELQKLCDSVRPIPDQVALNVIRQELLKQQQQQQDKTLEDIFTDIHLVASASLGQVYKARLRETGEQVAIKVQRPHTRKNFSLDLFLLHRLGCLIDSFTSIFTSQPPFHQALYESFARGSYAELDYENEAKNQLYFQKELADRNVKVVVPNVYLKLTTEKVLTTQWIDGIKLADCPKEQIRKLIPVGVELFLIQLLDIGAFHADPHVGNLLVTEKGGELCLLDFGLCTKVDLKERNAMNKAIIHLLARDFDSLVAQDAKELGFLPNDFDTSELKPLLAKILTVGLVESGSDLRKRKRKLMEISNELNEVFFRFPFSVPPFFALVTRGLGLLEGIALTGDPDFDIFQASAPYARRRAVALFGPGTFRRITRTATEC